MKKLLFFITLFILLIPKSYASSYEPQYDFTASLYDNYCTSLVSVFTQPVEGAGYFGTIPSMPANNCGAAWIISSPIPIISGRTYSLSMPVGIMNNSSTIELSSINRIGLGTSYNSAINSYLNNSNFNIEYSNSTGTAIQYVFKANINADYILVPFTLGTTLNDVTFTLDTISIEDMGSGGLTESDINNSLNNQTEEINSSIQNSTDTITDSITQTEENINNNINEKFEFCKAAGKNLFDYQNNTFTGPYYNSSGVIISSSFKSTINYINVKPNTSYTLSGLPVSSSNWFYIVYFDSSKNFVSRTGFSLTNSTKTITTPGRTSYILFEALPSVISPYLTNLQIEEGTSATSYESYREVCTNRIDETNSQLNDLNNNITSEDAPDTSGLSDVAGWLPAGPVDSLINLPLSLFNSISRDLGSSCSPITLPLPYVNKDLTLPCMSTFYEGIGIGDFMNWIGVIASGFMLFSYLMKLYKWVDDTLTFRENNHLDNWGGV